MAATPALPAQAKNDGAGHAEKRVRRGDTKGDARRAHLLRERQSRLSRHFEAIRRQVATPPAWRISIGCAGMVEGCGCYYRKTAYWITIQMPFVINARIVIPTLAGRA